MVLGSNVFNLAALIGLGAVVAGGIKLHRRVVIFEGDEWTPSWYSIVPSNPVRCPACSRIERISQVTVVLPLVPVTAAVCRCRDG